MRDLIRGTNLSVSSVAFAGMLVFSWLTIAFSQNVDSTSRKDDIVIKIPKAPTIMRTTGGRVLAYEFYITRPGSTEAPLPTSIKVFKDKEDVPILTLTGDTLAAAIAKPRDVLDANFLSPSRRTVVYMWVPLIGDDTPRNLRHRLTFSNSSDEIDAGGISIGKEILVIGPPVRVTIGWLGTGLQMKLDIAGLLRF
jgi:hypothetical protein